MKRRINYSGLIVVAAVWMVIINFSLHLLDAKSDLQLYTGGVVILGSIVVFPTIIRKLFGTQIKKDLDAVLGDEHKDKQ